MAAKHKDIHFSLLVVLMFAIAWTAMKLSLPALPTLIKVFGVSASDLKLSVSLFFAAYAASQLFWGAISEHFGRRCVILAGFSLAMVGTLIVISSIGIKSYIVGRCLEGIGIGVVSPVGRAILTDVYDRTQIARVLTIVSSSSGLMPALAPIIGGFILVGLGWRAIFIFFFIILASYTFWSYFKLPETHKPQEEATLASRFKGYLGILQHKKFWGTISCYAIIQGTLLGYYGAMPFWYVRQWHVPEQHYAFLALFTVAGYLVALMLTRTSVKYFSLEKLLIIGLLIGFIAAIIALGFALCGITGIWPLVTVMSLFAVSSGITFPCANANAMTYFKSQAAMLSALSSTFMFLVAAIASWIESHLDVHNLWHLSWVLLVASGMALITNYTWAYRAAKNEH